MGISFDYIERSDNDVPFPDWSLIESDQEAWRAANSRYWNAEPEQRGTYKCTNSWAGKIADALTEAGVLVKMEHGPWPTDGWRETPDGEQEPTDVGRAFLSRGAGQPFRVPSFKFSSGDGWIFAPQECEWMAHALCAHPDADVQAFGRFCAAAVERGGLVVG